jgi:hypothetical protein
MLAHDGRINIRRLCLLNVKEF